MRIGFLTQYYAPEMGAPQRRIGELAGFLVARGHQVRVLAAMPNYPAGRIFEGYRGLIRRETVDGVPVVRTWIKPSKSASIVPRMTSYLSFAASAAMAGPVAFRRLDYLFVESPPLFLGPTGILLARATGAKLIFNVSDLWPESAVRLGVVRRESSAYRAASALEARCYRAAWMVSGQSRTILEDIRARFPSVRTHHLSNGCDTTRFGARFMSPRLRQLLDPEGTAFVSIYAGLHGLAQGLDQILDAADRLRGTAHRFVLVGEGPEKHALVEAARTRRLENVAFLDPVPAGEVAALLATADAILVTLKTEIPGAVPSKIYEAMASERPLVLVAGGEAAEIALEAGCAVVAPGDIERFVGALETLRVDPDHRRRCVERGRESAVSRYDRAQIAQLFAEHLETGTR